MTYSVRIHRRDGRTLRLNGLTERDLAQFTDGLTPGGSGCRDFVAGAVSMRLALAEITALEWWASGPSKLDEAWLNGVLKGDAAP